MHFSRLMWITVQHVYTEYAMVLRRNGTPPLCDVLPFEINIENYFLLIGII